MCIQMINYARNQNANEIVHPDFVSYCPERDRYPQASLESIQSFGNINVGDTSPSSPVEVATDNDRDNDDDGRYGRYKFMLTQQTRVGLSDETALF
ncbi:hypothetical protein DY000_02009761 [Brassica cretica]|uniref:Uncharacterized protein n=1 Tax=Brassica cretica TaxID=69181 RepID=A0ABQ7C0J1_BRACR|nr:hypothetical protein DY000_02009761 [Brassica cretica]